MKESIWLFLLIVATPVACFTRTADAAQVAPTPFSTYGNIQNVQNYSSNPFWNKNSPYNQRFPKAIYVDGPDLNTGDCNRIVTNLITSYCSYNDCANLRINDIRPQIMVQLSQLPGHNFATSCGGYIDGIFEQYQKDNGNTSTVNIVQPIIQQQKTSFINTSQKPTDITTQRTAELERLQSITTPAAGVTATAFPKTTADLSFTERLANTAAGYKPYENLSAYKTPKIEEEYDYWNRMKSQNKALYCTEFPDDDICKESTEEPKSEPKTSQTPKSKPGNVGNHTVTIVGHPKKKVSGYKKKLCFASNLVELDTTKYITYLNSFEDWLKLDLGSRFVQYTGDGSDWNQVLDGPGKWVMWIGKTCDNIKENSLTSMSVLFGESALVKNEPLTSTAAGTIDGAMCYCRITEVLKPGAADFEPTNLDWSFIMGLSYDKVVQETNGDNTETRKILDDAQAALKQSCTQRCITEIAAGQNGFYYLNLMP